MFVLLWVVCCTRSVCAWVCLWWLRAWCRRRARAAADLRTDPFHRGVVRSVSDDVSGAGLGSAEEEAPAPPVWTEGPRTTYFHTHLGGDQALKRVQELLGAATVTLDGAFKARVVTEVAGEPVSLVVRLFLDRAPEVTNRPSLWRVAVRLCVHCSMQCVRLQHVCH